MASKIRILQQPDPEIGGELGQVARILVHTLIGIDPDRARIREPEGASGREPVLHQVVHQAVPELELQGFAEPALRHVEREERARDDPEDTELLQELA